jgi:hypothetical protein
MQEYVTRVERLPDGSLRTTLFRGGRRVHQEPVRTLRHGKRRAHDLLCSAVDTEWDDDRSAGSVVPCPGRPVAGSSAGGMLPGHCRPGWLTRHCGLRWPRHRVMRRCGR